MKADAQGRRGKQEASSPFPAEDWVRVGRTVRTIRELRGFTPDQFANEIGISRPYLANIEAGRKKLTNVLLARIASTLRIEQIAIMRPEVATAAA